MKSEKIKSKPRPRSPGHHLEAVSIATTKTENSGEVHPPDSKSSSFIDETINFWQKRTGKKLSRAEAAEAISNVCSFFRILSDWDHKVQDGDTRVEASVSSHAVRGMHGGKRSR